MASKYNNLIDTIGDALKKVGSSLLDYGVEEFSKSFKDEEKTDKKEINHDKH